MKDEIKEKIKAYYIGDDIDKIIDYITNLQEKYEKADYDRHKLFEQKEKAIEYINTHYLNANEPELLNILQGEDKNE